MEDEIKVKWPQDAKPLTGQQIRPDTPIMSADLDNQDDLSFVTFGQLSESVKEIIEVTGQEIAPLVGGETSGTALSVPAGPTGEVRTADVASGKWYNFGSGAVEATADKRWRAYWNGTSWSLVDMGELPGDPTEQEYNTNTELPLSGLAIGKGISKNFTGGENKLASARDVKELNLRVNFFDRPDLPYYYPIIGKLNRVYDRILSENYDGGRMLPEGTSVYYIDRPDLSIVILVDRDGRLLSSEESGGVSPSPISASQPNFAPWNPPVQQPFSIPKEGDVNQPLGNYDLLIAEYDALLPLVNINPNFGTYAFKSSIGTTNLGAYEIYKYSFIPPNPKAKVLLMGGTHANEKMYIECMYLFAKALCEDWHTNDFLSFLRWNVQIDILPCRSPYTLANDLPQWGSGQRLIPETPPVPFSWTRVGTTVTLTFEDADFPVSDGFLTPDNYFTSVPATDIIGKTSFYVPTSSDANAIPFGQYTGIYRIASVINSKSITFNVAGASGATTGTGEFQFWVDPNRNMEVPNTSNWSDFTAPQSVVFGIGDFANKGTRPLSLIENRLLVNNATTEKYDLIIDGHSDAGDNDIRYDTSSGFTPDTERMLGETSAFNAGTSNVADETSITTPYTTRALTRLLDNPFHTIEWGSGLRSANGTQVQDALRWMGIVLKNNIVKIINDKNS